MFVKVPGLIFGRLWPYLASSFIFGGWQIKI
jgi:hypothetical protein